MAPAGQDTFCIFFHPHPSHHLPQPIYIAAQPYRRFKRSFQRPCARESSDAVPRRAQLAAASLQCAPARCSCTSRPARPPRACRGRCCRARRCRSRAVLGVQCAAQPANPWLLDPLGLLSGDPKLLKTYRKSAHAGPGAVVRWRQAGHRARLRLELGSRPCMQPGLSSQSSQPPTSLFCCCRDMAGQVRRAHAPRRSHRMPPPCRSAARHSRRCTQSLLAIVRSWTAARLP